MCRSTGGSTWERVLIRFGTYNICNGWNSGLELSLQGISKANRDLGIFQETSLMGWVFTCRSSGYSVVNTDMSSRHCSGVAVLYRPLLQYAVEAIKQFRPKVVVFQIATGDWRWYIIGCYFVLNKKLTIESVVADLKKRPRLLELMVTGDFNANFEHPEKDCREEELAKALKTALFADMSAHFLLQRRPCCQGWMTWSVLRLGR